MLAVAPASAIDTVETFGKGEGDLEFYAGLDGLGAGAPDQAMGGSVVMGWGVAERLSAYATTGLVADGAMANAAANVGLGVFGTPLDTDHVDLDLLLDICWPGGGDPACVAPGIELNLDAEPDLATWGVFLDATAGVSWHAPEASSPERRVDWALGAGLYRSLGAGRQVLLRYDATVEDPPGDGAATFTHGGLALGFNAMLGDTMELVAEARTGFGHDGDPATIGFMVGFVATLNGTTAR